MKTTHRMLLLPILLATCTAVAAPAPAKEVKAKEKSKLAANERLEDYASAVERRKAKTTPKIVGGTLAKIADYPWQVSLGMAAEPDPFHAHFCGGSIYSATWIVTAAHCMRGATAEDIVVSAGTDKLGAGGERRKVKRIIVKKDYNHARSDNDIALIELEAPFALSDKIKPIGLMTGTEEVTWMNGSKPLRTAGWGATTEGGNPVRDLRHVNVPHVSRNDCNQSSAYNGRISDNMVCAGATGIDACQGDSGGPLSTLVGTTPKLYGIVSWGIGCAKLGKVGVYARVANYTAWVGACVAQPGSCE